MLFDPEQSLSARVRAVVAKHGSRRAVGTGDWRPTYAELDEACNRLANNLISDGVTPGDRVAILMRHDGPQIAAMLASLKAGAVVVILNRTDPPGRLREVVAATEPRRLVADTESADLAAQVSGSDAGVMRFDPRACRAPSYDPAVDVSPQTAGFLIYTSGSSGRPKIVIQTHRFVLHNALRHTITQRLRPDDRIALIASLSGAQGMGTAWSALANGATLLLYPTMESGIGDLATWLNEHRITIYVSASSVHRQFMRTLADGTKFPSVRLVQITSEWATADDFKTYQKHFLPSCEFIHGLGSSETGNVTRLRLKHGDAVDDGRLPIGRPSEGMEVLIVDGAGRPVAPGDTGEMMVRSRFLTGGYWRDEALTRERFSTDPVSGMMTYRGGDLARVNARGLLEFMGRRDAAVKVGGFYVDPAEVEEALLRLPGVERAAVVPWSRPHGQSQLVAYVLPRDQRMKTASAIRSALHDVLPRHMVPPIIRFPDSIPLTPQGKIDREQLKQHRPAPSTAQELKLPETATEALVADAWAAEFQVAHVSRQDDFFDLGGDSLIAAMVTARIHEALGVEIHIGTVFDHPTLADFAHVIDGLQAKQTNTAAAQPRSSRHEPFPLSFGQEYYWQTSQSPKQTALHVATNCRRIVGPLNKDVLHECINILAQRHESLRTSFAAVDGRPVQIVHPALRLPLPFHDFSGAPHAVDEAWRIIRTVTAEPFDIAQAPLVRFTLVRMGENEHWLLNTHHHIISDGWSWNIFFRELGRTYEAKIGNRNDPGIVPPRQYGDYALWQRQTFQPNGSRYRSELSWWVDHIVAAAYPDRSAYRRALAWCIRAGSSLPRAIKKMIGLFLLRSFQIPQPVRKDLPFKRAQAVHGLDTTEGFLRLTIAPAISQRLAALARREGATNFAVRLAAYAVLLAAESGDAAVTVGTYFSTRNRAVTRELFGFCANHAMLVLRCDGKQSFREFVAVVRDHLRAVQSHGEFPYEALYREVRAWRIRLPQIQSHVSIATPHADIDFAGLRLSYVRDSIAGAMPPGFDVKFGQDGEGDQCEVIFDANAYDPSGARAFMSRFVDVLDAVSQDPDLAIGEALASRDRQPGSSPGLVL